MTRARGLSAVHPTRRGLLEVLRHPLKRPQGVEALRASWASTLAPPGAGERSCLEGAAELARSAAGG